MMNDKWQKINENGFGNKRNRYAWSMGMYTPPNEVTPRLYVGTTSDFDGPPRPEIWSLPLDDLELKTWYQEYQGKHRGFRKMKVFNDQLYVGTLRDPPFFRWLLYLRGRWGCQLYRYDGNEWMPVIDPGFGTKCYSVRSMEIYKNQLYVGTSNLLHGGQIWRTKEGVTAPRGLEDWEQCNDNGFGKDVQNTGIFSLKVFDNYLWAGTANGVSGCELWRYDGKNWERMSSHGFISRFNIAAMNMEVFNNQLYIGTYNPESGSQIWRYPAQTAFGWENIMTGGFYNPKNAYIWSLKTHKDKGIDYLYAGTFIGIELETGAELWRSETGNGNEWECVVSNGFGDKCNYGIRNLISYKNQLFAGTARPPKILTFSKKYESMTKRVSPICKPGCEIWRYSGDIK
jgi:hypothetical protein